MAEEIKQWEYRVQTIGSLFGTKDEYIQATLDELGFRRLKRLTFMHYLAAERSQSLPSVL
jgi:hypothetical protein